MTEPAGLSILTVYDPELAGEALERARVELDAPPMAVPLKYQMYENGGLPVAEAERVGTSPVKTVCAPGLIVTEGGTAGGSGCSRPKEPSANTGKRLLEPSRSSSLHGTSRRVLQINAPSLVRLESKP